MKLGYFVAVITALGFSLSAQAEDRWIIKNALVLPKNVKVVKTITFGEDIYHIVKSEKSQSDLRFAFKADSVIRDARIGLDVPPPAVPAVQEGWHVRRMNYDRIPNGINGEGVVVAVLDTGVALDHESLANHLWVNTGEIPNNGIDDDKNGYIDDVNGWDFTDRDSDPRDQYGHGTHCAGIVAADKWRNGTSRGVAPGAKIMAVRIIGRKMEGFLSDAAEGIKYAVDNGAQVLSNSWRVYGSWGFEDKDADILFQAIKYAESKNVIFVAAAGNEARDISKGIDPIYPAGMVGLSNMLIVAATEEGDVLADYSNYGANNVAVAAPGSEIYSTVLDNKWEAYSGTSMATPLVAGVIALGLQKGLTPIAAKNNLISTSFKDSKLEGKVSSGGIVDIINYIRSR